MRTKKGRTGSRARDMSAFVMLISRMSVLGYRLALRHAVMPICSYVMFVLDVL